MCVRVDELERRPAVMKLKLQLIIESDSGEAQMVREVTKLERYALRPETLGLTLSEAKELLPGGSKSDGHAPNHRVCDSADSLREMWKDPIAQREASNRVADALRQVAT